MAVNSFKTQSKFSVVVFSYRNQETQDINTILDAALCWNPPSAVSPQVLIASISGDCHLHYEISLTSRALGAILLHWPRESSSNSGDFVDSIYVLHDKVVTVPFHPILASLVLRELSNSSTFCSSFLRYITSKHPSCKLKFKPTEVDDCWLVSIPLLVEIVLLPTSKQILDYKWAYRILGLLTKYALLDDAMNWLNTLGGGYSALGDQFEYHSKEAARIAVHQWRVATELNDVALVIRCYLYFALSLMQRGELKAAKRILRCQYHNAKHLAAADHRLRAMCLGLWSRLKYYYSLQNGKQLSQASLNGTGWRKHSLLNPAYIGNQMVET